MAKGGASGPLAPPLVELFFVTLIQFWKGNQNLYRRKNRRTQNDGSVRINIHSLVYFDQRGISHNTYYEIFTSCLVRKNVNFGLLWKKTLLGFWSKITANYY